MRILSRCSAVLRALPYSLADVYRSRGCFRQYHVCAQVLAVLFVAGSAAFCEQREQPDLTQKSLEDLMNIEVTSVSKKEQKMSQAAAAVFVISADDIHRSGALRIPDLLRMVPGVEVAQLNGSVWAISARGFNGQESNKLLVMIDGRTVYNPIFAGVFWDAENVPLDSIERIEIIRGPGAAVWGANAVNGVINIITRAAANTQGTYIVAGADSLGTTPEMVRYGGRSGQAAYRAYAEGFHTQPQYAPDKTSGRDDWDFAHGGFRTDLQAGARDFFMAEGELYRGNAGELVSAPVSIAPPVTSISPLRDRYSGWNLLTRWSRTISSNSDTALQVYFDRSSRGDTSYSFDLNTFDIDFQHHLAWRSRQDLVWGLGYRFSENDAGATYRISFTPENRELQLFSAFAQNEITIVPERLFTTVGVRLEHNTYSGFDAEPSIRLAWTPNKKNMFWSAISGADRTPARSDTEIRVNLEATPSGSPLPLLVSYFGNPKQKNEHVNAFEAGYRNTVSKALSVDATAFFNQYQDLQSVEPGAIVVETNPAPVHLLLPWRFANGLYGETHGFDMFANWKPTSFWNLSPGYSYLTAHIHRFRTSQDAMEGPETEGSTPNHQADVRSHVDLWRGLGWDVNGYFVGRLPAVSVPSYTRVDSIVTWRAGERVSFSAVGQNLLRDRHMEYAGPDSSVQSGLIRREAYARMTWTF